MTDYEPANPSDENSKDSVCEKMVIDLLNGNLTFFVPTYQRGYRWTDDEVTALLNDINNSEDRYCLQPLIVKKDKEGKWELIDGQQRLTTLYLILNFLISSKNSCELLSRSCLYKIEYETRANLLDDINKGNDIDSYFVSQAKRIIKTWFEDHKCKESCFCNKLLHKTFFIWYQLPANENDNVAIKTFIKENANKIPLTSSELIRALLLSEDDKNTTEEERDLSYKDRQLIAIEWENIEYQLKKDWFWYFLSNEDNTSTRIDLVFDCLARYYYDEIKHDQDNVFKKPGFEKTDPRFSFYVFDSILNDKDIRQIFVDNIREIQPKEEIDKEYLKKYLWDQALECFSFFEDCYEDFEKYHKIGYLVCVSKSRKRQLKPEEVIFSIYREYRKEKLDLNKMIKDEVDFTIKINRESKRLIKTKTTEEVQEVLQCLVYGKDNEKIYNVLLLFNILTILGHTASSQVQGQLKSPNSHNDDSVNLSKEGSGESPYENHYRFPFDKYKRKKGRVREKWDLEHIHAVNSQLPKEAEEITIFLDALVNTYTTVRKKSDGSGNKEYQTRDDVIGEFINKIEKLQEHLKQGKKPVDIIEGYKDTIKEYTEKGLLSVENGIMNLTLLDSGTNRSYKDAPFNYKRRILIERETNGQFIPICTRNVFLKVYTENPDNLVVWGKNDQENYLRQIAEVLNRFFNTGEKTNE